DRPRTPPRGRAAPIPRLRRPCAGPLRRARCWSRARVARRDTGPPSRRRATSAVPLSRSGGPALEEAREARDLLGGEGAGHLRGETGHPRVRRAERDGGGQLVFLTRVREPQRRGETSFPRAPVAHRAHGGVQLRAALSR